jgi:hypothetical protein
MNTNKKGIVFSKNKSGDQQRGYRDAVQTDVGVRRGLCPIQGLASHFPGAGNRKADDDTPQTMEEIKSSVLAKPNQGQIETKKPRDGQDPVVVRQIAEQLGVWSFKRGAVN